jgi:hypothetical protein
MAEVKASAKLASIRGHEPAGMSLVDRAERRQREILCLEAALAFARAAALMTFRTHDGFASRFFRASLAASVMEWP